MMKGLIDAAVNVNIELGRLVDDSTSAGFNVFTITGIQGKEVMMCRFLHELLSPTGSHGMGRLFLREFFVEALNLSIGDEELDFASTRLEESLCAPDGQRLRPDIVIETPCRLIIVEAKITADEGYNQCAGYLETARALNTGKPVTLYFLTIDGHAAYSTDEACAISWRTHVLGWLEKVLELSQDNPRIRENVEQYMEAVMQITGKGGLHEAMRNIINTPETVRAAWTISNELVKLQNEFLAQLFADIDKALAGKYERVSSVPVNIDFYASPTTRHKNTSYINITYEAKELGEYSLCMCFEVSDKCYIGYVLMKNGKSCGPLSKYPADVVDQARSLIDREALSRMISTDYWLGYLYVPCLSRDASDESIPDFWNCNDVYYDLWDESKRCEFVAKIAEGFRMLKLN